MHKTELLVGWKTAGTWLLVKWTKRCRGSWFVHWDLLEEHKSVFSFITQLEEWRQKCRFRCMGARSLKLLKRGTDREDNFLLERIPHFTVVSPENSTISAMPSCIATNLAPYHNLLEEFQITSTKWSLLNLHLITPKLFQGCMRHWWCTTSNGKLSAWRQRMSQKREHSKHSEFSFPLQRTS